MMNPHDPPLQPTGDNSTNEVSRIRLRRVATYQRWVLYTVLANIGLYIAMMAIDHTQFTVWFIVMVALVCMALFGVLSVFLLANELYSPVIGALCAVLVIVPFVALITLVIISQKATGILQANGIEVGLLGANPSQI